jgi:hypothetical protein
MFVEGPCKTCIFDKSFQCRDFNSGTSQYEAWVLPTAPYRAVCVARGSHFDIHVGAAEADGVNQDLSLVFCDQLVKALAVCTDTEGPLSHSLKAISGPYAMSFQCHIPTPV